MVEQGLSFAVIERSSPFEDPGQRSFQRAQVIWFGEVPGAEWLHDSVQREFGPLIEPYSIESRRESVFIGASGEVAYVLLTLMGVPLVAALKKMGDRAGDDFYAWLRR